MRRVMAGVGGMVVAAWLAVCAGPADNFHFVLLGDRTGETQPGVYERVWRELAAAQPAFVLSVGDTIQGLNDATAETEWREAMRIVEPYRRIPLYLAPGNHDIWSEASERLFRQYAGRPRMSLLTHDEQLTLMTLWFIARSPLMFGGHLPDNDEFTLHLITNEEVLAVNQKASKSKELFTKENQVAWLAEMPAELPGSPAKYLAVFNIGDTADENIRVNRRDLGLPANCAVRDLWAKKDLGTVRDGQAFKIAPHATAFFKLTPGK